MKILAAVIVAAGFVGLTAPVQAATISLNELLKNPSFEGGVHGTTGCPEFWSCTINSGASEFKVTAPTAGQYPDPNGLPGSAAGQLVPDGASVAFSPTNGSRATITQSIALAFATGNTYTLDFWLGNPLDDPQLVGPGGAIFPEIRVSIFDGSPENADCNAGFGSGRKGSVSSGGTTLVEYNTSGNRTCTFTLTPSMTPADGDWRLYTLAYSPGSSLSGLGGNIGIHFDIYGGAHAAGNGTLMHLDIPGPAPAPLEQVPVPEPATIGLLGMGLLSVGARLRSRKRQ